MLPVPSLEKLIHELSRLPGIGPKSAQRLAYHILRAPEFSRQLRAALSDVEERVQTCQTCFSYCEDRQCRFCADTNRNDQLICVVEQPLDILRIESSGAFRGRYHVLQGVISPLDGVTARDLRIPELLTRARSSEKPVSEIILALDADIEGDTTALYLKRELQNTTIKLTRLAHGVPFGGNIDYIDHRTLGLALDHRVEF